MNGGAARAAYSLHRALLKNGVTSRMRVGRKHSDDPTVTQGSSRKFTVNSLLDRQLWRSQKSPRSAWRSPARFSSISASEINSSGADVVNLHWVTDGFISVEEIGKIEIPVVWSMYDMWPFSGTEHYGNLDSNRWRDGYTKLNRPADESGFDLDRWTFHRKLESWARRRSKMHMVPASNWLEHAIGQSYLMAGWPITRIPHVVDTDAFAPMNKREARQQLGLPADRPTILFLTSAGIGDRRKGWDLLERAMPDVAKQYPNLQIVVVGPIPNDEARMHAQQATQATIHWHGTVSTSEQLRTLYCAADVTAVPSREDNLPLTAMEAQTSATPVVAFAVGGLPEIVENDTTGYLASPLDYQDFTRGLQRVLQDGSTKNFFGHQARLRALDRWSSRLVARQYGEVYLEAIEGYCCERT